MSDGNERNLTSRPAIAMKIYGPLHYFTTTQKWFKKIVVWTNLYIMKKR